MTEKKKTIKILPYHEGPVYTTKIDTQGCDTDMQNVADALASLLYDDDLYNLVHRHQKDCAYMEAIYSWEDKNKRNKVLAAFKCSLNVPFDLNDEKLKTTEGAIKHLCRQYLKLQLEDGIHWGAYSFGDEDTAELTADNIDNDEVFDVYYEDMLKSSGVKEYWSRILLVLLTTYWWDEIKKPNSFIVDFLRSIKVDIDLIPGDTCASLSSFISHSHVLRRRSEGSDKDTILVKAYDKANVSTLKKLVKEYQETDDVGLGDLQRYMCQDSVWMVAPADILEGIGTFCGRNDDTKVQYIDYSLTEALIYTLEVLTDRYPILGLSKILYHLPFDYKYSIFGMQAYLLRLESELDKLDDDDDEDDEYDHHDCECEECSCETEEKLEE